MNNLISEKPIDVRKLVDVVYLVLILGGLAWAKEFFPLLRSPCDFQAGKKFSFPQKKRIRVR
jgi:hypothetical protein